MRGKMSRAIWLAAVALLGAPLEAQTLAVISGPGTDSIGNVTVGLSGSTTFRVSTAGGVTVQAGTGSRQTIGSVANSFVLRCTNGAGSSRRCSTSGKSVKVRITPTTTTGRASPLTLFQMAGGNGLFSGPTLSGNSTLFVLNNLDNAVDETVTLGYDFLISGGFGTTGAASASYTIEFGFDTGYADAPAQSGIVTATTRNPTQIVKDSDLRFGTIAQNGAGTGTVTISATDGARGITSASGVALANQASNPTGRAKYTITSEGGQVISVSVPATATLTGPGGNITVNLTKDFTSPITVTGSAGTSAVKELGVGGTLPVTRALSSGVYSGTFNVVFSWN